LDYFLKSSRLGFRCWEETDLSLAEDLWGNPAVTALIGGPFPPDIVRARLHSEIAQMRSFGVQYWPVFVRNGNRHCGCAGLRPYRIEDRIYELGVHFLPAFWGRGLAQEASRAVIDYAFGPLRANELFAGHHPENERSRQLLLKLGFVHTHEELYPPTGLQHTSYSLRKKQELQVPILSRRLLAR